MKKNHANYKCNNCGEKGHIFRNCLSPVTSYGIIAVRYTDPSLSQFLFSNQITPPLQNDNIQFLLIQRKDSLAYIEFIRGKYNYQDDSYISNLLKLDKNLINLKGKTVEKLGLIGKEKAIACEVICSISE